MATFVFVAGGWHGGWCWRRVTDRLRAAGHETFAPTLTGLADRAHLLGPTVDLDTHIADVLGLLEWEDLTDVVLVGHSYGGMVLTGVADRAPHRLALVVYLDALWPEDGETTSDVIGTHAADAVSGAGVDPSSPPLISGGEELAKMLGVTDPDDVKWMASRLTPQPPATMTQTLRFRDPVRVPILYVKCVDSPGIEDSMQLSWRRAERRAAEDANVRVVSLDAPHNAMVTHPAMVADALLGATRQP